MWGGGLYMEVLSLPMVVVLVGMGVSEPPAELVGAAAMLRKESDLGLVK